MGDSPSQTAPMRVLPTGASSSKMDGSSVVGCKSSHNALQAEYLETLGKLLE